MKKYLLSIFIVGMCLVPIKGFSWGIFRPELDGIMESQENAYTFLKACKRRDALNSCEEYDKKLVEIGTEVDNH